MAKSAPSSDLEPLHRYRIEDRRQRTGKTDASTQLLSSSLGASVRSTTAAAAASGQHLSSSILARLVGLQIEDDDVIHEGVEEESPHITQEEPGVVLANLQRKLGLDTSLAYASATEMDELDLTANEDDEEHDEELLFELS